MIYVYDVLVNLSDNMYDFYDWFESDDFKHIRRTPLFKVSDLEYADIVFKKIKVSEEFLKRIQDKTQVFSSKNVEVVPYMCVISTEKESACVLFSSKGVNIKKSKFLIVEEAEIVDLATGINYVNIDYEVLNNKINFRNVTRKNKEVIDSILEFLSSIKDDKEKIDYLYYEWFDKVESNKYEMLVKDIKKSFSNKHLEFLELTNLMQVKK